VVGRPVLIICVTSFAQRRSSGMDGAAGFQIQVCRRRDHVDLHVRGELDLMTVSELGRSLVVAAAVPVRKVVVDLTDATFVDVVSMNVISETANQLARQGRLLRVCGLSDYQSRVWRNAPS
jgi:anti-anti-sigma factor